MSVCDPKLQQLALAIAEAFNLASETPEPDYRFMQEIDDGLAVLSKEDRADVMALVIVRLERQALALGRSLRNTGLSRMCQT